MSNGWQERKLLHVLAGRARAEYEERHKALEKWKFAHRDAYFRLDAVYMADWFAHHADRAGHLTWGYLMAAGRAACAGVPTFHSLLGDQLHEVGRALAACVDWAAQRLGAMLTAGYGRLSTPELHAQLAHHAGNIVHDLLDLRWCLAGLAALNDYRDYRWNAPEDLWPSESFDHPSRMWTCVRHQHNDATLWWRRASELLRELVEVSCLPVSAIMWAEDTRRNLVCSRLEYALARYKGGRAGPEAWGDGRLTYALSGAVEGLDPVAVQAGLARTFALAQGSDFPDGTDAPNGVVADWREEKELGPASVLTDLRAFPAGGYCPTFRQYQAHLHRWTDDLRGPLLDPYRVPPDTI